MSDVETFVCCFNQKCSCLFKMSAALTITSQDAWLTLSAVVSRPDYYISHSIYIYILFFGLVSVSSNEDQPYLACITEQTHEIRVCGLCDGTRFAVAQNFA